MYQLHDVAEQYRAFVAQIDDMMELVDAGEMDEGAIWDTLEAIAGEVDEKADTLATLYKSLRYESAALADEVKRLQERKKAKEARAERLLAYLGGVLASCGRTKIETTCNVIRVGTSRRVEIEDEGAFIGWAQEYNPDLLRFKQPEPDKTAIGRLLKDGATIEGARLETVEHVNIK